MRSEGSDHSTIGDVATLFEHAPSGHVIVSLSGEIVSVNATLSDWLGVERGTLVGSRFRNLLTLPGRILYETNFAPMIRLRGVAEEISLDLLSGSGVAVPVIASARAVKDERATPVATLVVFLRSHARKEYENELKSRETVAAADLADAQETAILREQFIAVLGHDLRNPLASLIGGTRLLRREALSDKAAHVLDMMDGSVDRMAGLIDDVMDFARGQLGGGIVLDLKLQPLEPVLNQVVGEFENARPDAQIDCHFDLAGLVSFDASRLGQLVSNLIGNAFTHGDPREPVRLVAEAVDNRLVLSVANAGKPIPLVAMARLFQPFFRGEVRPKQQGLGLGLHIASEIARAHGGSLSATSSEIETRFTLAMPMGN